MLCLNVVNNVFRSLGRSSTRLESIEPRNINLTLTQTMRWCARKPVAIVNEHELYNAETTKEMPTRSRNIRRAESRQSKLIEKTKETSTTVKDKKFTVFEHNDPTVTSFMTKLKSQKRKENNGKIILEGYRLIKDALLAGARLDTILFNNYNELDKLDHPIPDDVKHWKVPYATIRLWSSLTTSPGVMGIFMQPGVNNYIASDNFLPLTIICDNVRDPRNLGSIMRSAAAVGCEKLILMKGCVDLWDSKVLRTASGAHFRLPIHASSSWNQIPTLISESSNIFIADSNFGDEFVSRYDSDTLQPSLGIFDLDPERIKLNQSIEFETESNQPTNRKAMADFLLKLPIVPYYAVDYTKQEMVLVLSGETEGLTFDSYNLLKERKAIRINIPMANGIESLNTGVALGIVGFEMKRQFVKRQHRL